MACLINKAVGHSCFAVLIDHGLLRKNEAKECVDSLKNELGINIHLYDESEIFFSRLKSVIDPEEKRKIIGDQFIKSFDKISDDLGGYKFLGQGTLYPDVIESGISTGGVCLFEWASIIEEVLPENVIKIDFTRFKDHPERRRLNIFGFIDE